MPLLRLLLGVLLLFVALPAWSADDDTSRWFEIDSLNPGLADPRPGLDRETPRSTLESMMQLARKGELEQAAHILDLSDIPSSEQGERGAELARKLEEILDRRVYIPWDLVVDRADGVDENGRSDDPMVGRARRSLRLATLKVDGIPVAVRLNRVKVEGEEPVWVFSRQTVQHVDALYEAYGPGALERWLPGSLKQDAVLGLERWELIGIPTLVLLAGFVSWATWRITSRYRTRADWFGWAAGAVRLPATLAAGALVSWVVVTHVMPFSGPANMVLQPVLVSAVALAVALLLVQLIDRAVEAALGDDIDDLTHRDNAGARDLYTNLSAFRRLLWLVGVGFAFGLVLTQTTAFANLGLSLLASASVVGVVLGFAGRAVLSNILASLQIAFSKNARLGDQIVFDDYLCHVERIHFTYVQLRTWDRKRLIVPVTELTSKPFVNLSAVDPETTRSAYIHLDHRADVTVLDDCFYGFAEKDERVIKVDEAERIVLRHEATSVVCRYAITCASAEVAWDTMCDLQEVLLTEARRLELEEGVVVLPTEREARIDDELTGRVLAKTA